MTRSADNAEDLTLKATVCDGDGLLTWTEEIEDIFQETNEGGKALALMPQGPILLMGWDLRTPHRSWATRLLLEPCEAADGYPMRYRIMFQFLGEPRGQAMYPRMPFEHQFTGRVETGGDLDPMIASRLAEVDTMAEEVHIRAVAGTREAMKGHMDRLLNPKPWWQFW